MELAHVIVSMLDSKPSKVQCKTCRGTHKYKTAASLTRVTKTRSPRATKTVIKVSEIWEQKLAKKSKEDVAPYKANAKFIMGDVLQHPTFGVGIVEEVRGTTKVLVLFREGEKLLVHSIA